MPLTPADVANKEFSVATRFKKGYDEEEVDAFLDEVEKEIARLLTENNELRARVSALQAQLQSGGGAAAPAAAASDEPARPPAEITRAAVPPPAQAVSPGETEQAALRTLQMAQRTAEQVVNEARAEADKMLVDARGRAGNLEREAQERHQAVLGGLEQQRNAAEARLEELRTFEREYRTRLKAYLEQQLR
ncbi:MAG: hypothetical protein QOK14_1243, partial [Frankiaceae bacterium]|nr:hypothetical protein [Frankiaceae bacterium]